MYLMHIIRIILSIKINKNKALHQEWCFNSVPVFPTLRKTNGILKKSIRGQRVRAYCHANESRWSVFFPHSLTTLFPMYFQLPKYITQKYRGDNSFKTNTCVQCAQTNTLSQIKAPEGFFFSWESVKIPLRSLALGTNVNSSAAK